MVYSPAGEDNQPHGGGRIPDPIRYEKTYTPILSSQRQAEVKCDVARNIATSHSIVILSRNSENMIVETLTEA